MAGVSGPKGTSASKLRKQISRAKVRAHRERLKKCGLKPVQFWVPDVTSATFRAEAHQQSCAVGASRSAAGDQAFIDAVSNGSDE